ncbi:hypothetical protein GIB67_025718 [Kingdonia uniflora]|uniref:Uncharacterized protein n=1 Tax=Kingdonia uniflora TaxID=39325 RepID=A0A7J7KW61_9MAGN|nr:hypothetical protein GIB67_025718 [Kingdonia uniflora]
MSFRSTIPASWLRLPGCGAPSLLRLRILTSNIFLCSFYIVYGQTRDCVKVFRAYLASSSFFLRNELILSQLSPL